MAKKGNWIGLTNWVRKRLNTEELKLGFVNESLDYYYTFTFEDECVIISKFSSQHVHIESFTGFYDILQNDDIIKEILNEVIFEYSLMFLCEIEDTEQFKNTAIVLLNCLMNRSKLPKVKIEHDLINNFYKYPITKLVYK